MTTRILMSFAMADGGMMFVQWLRNKLMRDYGLYSTNSVYVDFVTARAGDCYYSVTPEVARPHYATVKIDDREHMRSSTGARPIGAMHPDWKDMFEKAMDEAEVVLFVLTEKFFASEWCRQELAGFKHVVNKRVGVRGIMLALDGVAFNASDYGLPQERMAVIAQPTEAYQGGMLWDRGLWRISDAAYGQLIREIGEHGEWREG